jgi:hypothetical protein
MEVTAWFLFLLWSFAPVITVSLKQQSTSGLKQASVMVKQRIYGVERDIDIPVDVFPTEHEMQEMEDAFSVKGEHGWFDSCYKGAKLHYQKWLPAGKPNAIIVYMHGIQTTTGKGCQLKDGRKVNMPLMVEGMYAR